MPKQQRIAGYLLSLLGLYVTIYSFTKLEVGSPSKPGSGFFTMICGTGILLLSVIWLVTNMRKKAQEEPMWENGSWLKPALALVCIILYAIAMEPVGYVLSTVLFIAVWQVLVCRSKPLMIVVFSIVGSLGMWFVFEHLLSVPLPNGLLGI